MKRSKHPLAGLLGCLAALLVSAIGAAQESETPTQESTQQAVREQITKSADAKRYDLLVEFAKANLELAEVELEYALQEYRKSPGVVPKLTIERLRSNLEVAKEQYTEATLASAGGLERVRRRHAEEKIRVAKLTLESGQKMHREGSITDLELRRLKLKYKLATLNLELMDNPEKFVTLLYHLEAKLGHLGEEILALDKRISDLEPLR